MILAQVLVSVHLSVAIQFRYSGNFAANPLQILWLALKCAQIFFSGMCE